MSIWFLLVLVHGQYGEVQEMKVYDANPKKQYDVNADASLLIVLSDESELQVHELKDESYHLVQTLNFSRKVVYF